MTSAGAPLPDALGPAASKKWIGALIGAAGVAAVGILAFAFLYAPGPPRLTLTPQSLAIHDRFYPVTVQAASIDVEHIRVVDIRAGSEWRPTLRTNGFANSSYHAGWFRVANGRTVRIYRATGTQLVLLPPRGSGVPVLLEAQDPEWLVDELQQVWQRSGG